MAICHYAVSDPATEQELRQRVADIVLSDGTLSIAAEKIPDELAARRSGDLHRTFFLQLLAVQFGPFSVLGQDTASLHWVHVAIDEEGVVAQEVS